MLTFRDSNKSFQLNGDLLKLLKIYKFNDGHSNAQDRKMKDEFGKEMKLNNKQVGRKKTKEESLKYLLNSSAILASGISTLILLEDPNELWDILKLLLQGKQARRNLIDEEFVPIVVKFLEYKCISKEQQKILPIIYLN